MSTTAGNVTAGLPVTIRVGGLNRGRCRLNAAAIQLLAAEELITACSE